MKLENVHVQDSAAKKIYRVWQIGLEKASHFAGGVLVFPETQQEMVAIAYNYCAAVLKFDPVTWRDSGGAVSIPFLLSLGTGPVHSEITPAGPP